MTHVEVRLHTGADGPGMPEVLALSQELCGWRIPPTEWCGGRAGWHRLPAELAARTGLAALKLKGLGQAPGDDAPAAPPAAALYERWPGQQPDPHFGIGPDLEFCLLTGDPAPLGGLLLTGAEREQRCARALSAAGVPTVVPVAAFAFTSITACNELGGAPLGVSVTGSSEPSPTRCSVLVRTARDHPRIRAEVRKIAVQLGHRLGDSDSVVERLYLLREVYRRFGESLTRFSAAGWYRYSGHPDNIAIDAKGRAVLVDLDSCREADPSRPDLAAMQEVRDGMSGLYNLACTFFRADVHDAFGDAELLEHEPFSGFLDGWDPGSSGQNAAVGRALARYVIAARARLVRFRPFLRHPDPIGAELYRYVRHDRDLTFALLYRIAWERRWKRPGRNPPPFDLAELDARLLRFAGRERFQGMRRILAEISEE